MPPQDNRSLKSSDWSFEPSSLSMVIVMGVTGAGKSHFINQLAGRQVVEEGADLKSCTQNCQPFLLKVGQTKTLLLDTPGFDDTTRPDSEILAEIAKILTAQYQSGVQLKGIVYVHRISDIRYGRSAVKTFDIFSRLCGVEAMPNVLLVTSRWSDVPEHIGAERERQLRDEFWSYMLRRGSRMSRFHGDRHSAIGLVSQLLVKDTVVLELQHEIIDEGRLLSETAAGNYVRNGLDKLKVKYEEELQALERLKAQLREDELEMRRQVERDWEKERAALRRAEEQKASLNQNVVDEVRRETRRKRDSFPALAASLVPLADLFGLFVGIPPGVAGVLVDWVGALFPSRQSR